VTFRPAYALAALVLFAVEVAIALFIHDGFVRSYLGDVLAVSLVYAALRAMTPLGLWPAIAVTLAIAAAIEIAQFFDIVGVLGLGESAVVRAALGGAFDWLDLAAYLAGAGLAVAVEMLRRRA
jgi:hypothetical protein